MVLGTADWRHTTNTPAVVALQEETRPIPIIFANLSDPVETGLVSNLAHPGGNVTEFAAFQYSMAGKWLEILREAIPNLTRVAFLFVHLIRPRKAH